MSISGGIKFFDINYAYSPLLASYAATNAGSGANDGNEQLSRNPYIYYNAGVSTDIIEVFFTMTFSSARTLNRIFMLGINFKDFTVEYWNGSAWVNFTNVITQLSSTPVTGIDYASFATDFLYAEFDSISTTSVRWRCLTTQTVNANKQINKFIATFELGTLLGFPTIDLSHSNNANVQQSQSGYASINKRFKIANLNLGFNAYPVQADIDLLLTLFERSDPFLVWLCGGNFGTTYFRFSQLGYRLKDLYLMDCIGDLGANYYANIFVNAPVTAMSFTEAIYQTPATVTV